MTVRLLDVDAPEWSEFLHQTPHDFYHLPAYVAMCAAREQGEARALLVDDGPPSLLLPLIIRPINGSDCRDATSPYGYPGPLVRGTEDPSFLSGALSAGLDALRTERIVTVFVRSHPLLNPAPPVDVGEVVLHGDTVSIDLTLTYAEHLRQMRHNHRRDIRRAVACGLVALKDTEFVHYDAFRRLYRETMDRHSAAPFYFFDDAYFDGLREALGERLHLLVVQLEGEVVSAGLFAETAGIVQYHLGGTDATFYSAAASKLLVHFATGWATQRGNHTLHLGGGVGGADDSLLYFKSGFSPRRHPFWTLRAIIDETEYVRLVRAHDPAADPRYLRGYFPAYRAG
jgi:hypothetical protein